VVGLGVRDVKNEVQKYAFGVLSLGFEMLGFRV
jgi:hypothetical protein